MQTCPSLYPYLPCNVFVSQLSHRMDYQLQANGLSMYSVVVVDGKVYRLLQIVLSG